MRARLRVTHGLSLAFACVVGLAARAQATEPPDDDGEEPSPPPAPGAPAPRATSPAPTPAVDADGMLRVPGGTFAMGSTDPAAPPNERPAHTTSVKPFKIDRTEVTVGAYRSCVTQKRCASPAKTSALCTYDLGEPDLPITCVRWADADGFCRQARKRLPTEAEWEFAARGASGATYPWGNAKPHCGSAVTLMREGTAKSCSGPRPAKVGTHPSGASPFGVLDMIGNAEEWVQDFYAEHLAHVSPRAGASRVIRGGGWLSTPSASRATTRNWGSAMEAGPNVGFRCARDAL